MSSIAPRIWIGSGLRECGRVVNIALSDALRACIEGDTNDEID